MSPAATAGEELSQLEVTRWRERAVERSLRSARARALSRSDQFLRAASELLAETGRTDFTVQELVERAHLSLRSFYQHFASKDELLLALFEEAIAAYVARVQVEMARHRDPVEQLRAYVLDLCSTAQATADDGQLLSRALTQFHLRLAAANPPEVARALGPQVELAHRVIIDGVAAGRFRRDVEPQQLAVILTQTVIGVGHMNVLGTHLTGVKVDPDELWAFCLAGLSPPAAVAADGDGHR
ncbi:MAG TPA: helix-turn-helix domain-containing protein [Acidimicrobiales bacterium]|nr:helix-turn-helix domain-containing protein [Acidimicrobiales bacterium]